MIVESEAVRVLGRHIVGLLVFDPGRPKLDLVTTFVVTISGDWLLITAGHVLKEIRDDQIGPIAARLIDSLALPPAPTQRLHQDPIPFNFEGAPKFILGDETEFDCGVLLVEPLYRDLLVQNHVMPLDSDAWMAPPNDADFYMIAGFPSELAVPPSNLEDWARTNPSCTMHALLQLPDRPDAFEPKNTPREYFKIAMDSSLKSIKGMSGSPVFAFKVSGDGTLRYWLVGVQSQWVERLAYIEVCPVTSFLRYAAANLPSPP